MTTPSEQQHICPTCGTPMERYGRAWVCPKQRTEDRRISAALRARGVDIATRRISSVPF